MAGDNNEINGRVSTREFYDALLKQNGRMDDMERRIISRLDEINNCMPEIKRDVAVNGKQIEINKEEIDSLRKKSDAWNAGNTIGMLLTAIATAFGIHQNGG